MTVHRSQGTAHGFLVIRDSAGKPIGHGEIIQVAHGGTVTSRLVYHLPDNSIDEETTVFHQDRTFRLISDHHIQRGPFFKDQVDITVLANGQVTMHSTDDKGKSKVETQHIDLPPNIANGIVGTILDNVDPGTPPFELGMVAATGKGRLIKVKIAPEGHGRLTIGGVPQTASLFRIHIDLGGFAKIIAPIVGKQPADQIIWVVEDGAPVIVRQQGQLSDDGPILNMDFIDTKFEGSEGAPNPAGAKAEAKSDAKSEAKSEGKPEPKAGPAAKH